MKKAIKLMVETERGLKPQVFYITVDDGIANIRRHGAPYHDRSNQTTAFGDRDTSVILNVEEVEVLC